MFPPGRARLATSPPGSATYVKTIGIVLVAFFAAWDAAIFIVKDDVNFEADQPSGEVGKRFRVGLSESVLNGDVMPLNVT
jgi:hypothetical protein